MGLNGLSGRPGSSRTTARRTALAIIPAGMVAKSRALRGWSQIPKERLLHPRASRTAATASGSVWVCQKASVAGNAPVPLTSGNPAHLGSPYGLKRGAAVGLAGGLGPNPGDGLPPFAAGEPIPKSIGLLAYPGSGGGRTRASHPAGCDPAKAAPTGPNPGLVWPSGGPGTGPGFHPP